MNDRANLDPRERDVPATWMDAYVVNDGHGDVAREHRLVDIAAIRGILFRQRWLIAAILLLAAMAGLLATLLATPLYSAQSTVRIEPYSLVVLEGQTVDQGISSNQVYDLMETQAQVIGSRMLALEVADSLTPDQRSRLLGGPAGSGQESREILAQILKGSVSAEVPANNWIMAIDFTSSDPVLAAEIANAYLDAFVTLDLRANLADNEYAQTYLGEQIASVRGRLREAEQRANAYARSRGLILQPAATEEAEGTSGVTLTGTNLALINERVAEARANRIAAEQRWRAVRDLPASQLADVQANGMLQNLIGQRALKREELTELRERYRDDFPQVVTVRTQIGDLDAQINQTSADIKSLARTDYIVARNQEAALTRELGSVTGATLSEQDSQVEYGQLDREADALRAQLEVLLQRFNEVSSAADLNPGIVNPLDRAIVPSSPYSPNLFNNMLIAIMAGIGLAAVGSILREMLDDRVRSFEEVEDRIGLPLLGHTPYVKGDELQEQEANRFSPLMEAYSSIRSTLDFALPGGHSVIQFTSSQPGEGKSTTALLLARLFAQYGRSVLLVDGDLRRPSLGHLIGASAPKGGLAEVMLGEVELSDVISRDEPSGLHVLPVGQIPGNPAEIFASARLREFIARVRGDYSLVIFDSSPVLGLADAPLLASAVDGTIFVLEANSVQYRQARTALRRLRASGGRPIGAILTKYRSLQAGQPYDYQYAYYEYRAAS